MHGAKSLADLSHVTEDRGGGVVGAVPCDILQGQPWPLFVVSSFDRRNEDFFFDSRRWYVNTLLALRCLEGHKLGGGILWFMVA